MTSPIHHPLSAMSLFRPLSSMPLLRHFLPLFLAYFSPFLPKKDRILLFFLPKKTVFCGHFSVTLFRPFFPKEDHIFPKGGPYFSLSEPYFSLFCLTPFWNYAFSFFASEEAVFFPFFAPENPESHTKKIVNL